MIEIGVIGAGGHSRRNHGPALSRCRDDAEDVSLAAVCDLNEERAQSYAKEFGFDATYVDFDRMLESESLDAIVAVTPTEATQDIACDFLSRGVPLLIEKPPGATSEETRAMLEVAREHDADHMISFNRRFNPAVQRAREWLSDRSPPSFALARQRRVDRLESNFVVGTGIHLVDTVLSFMETPVSVSGHEWLSQSDSGESASAHLQFQNGATASVSILPDAGRSEETHELCGPGYSIRVDTLKSTLSISVEGSEVKSWQIDPNAPKYERNGTLAETEAFLAGVRGDRSFSPTLESGLTTMHVTESIATGGERRLDEARSR